MASLLLVLASLSADFAPPEFLLQQWQTLEPGPEREEVRVQLVKAYRQQQAAASRVARRQRMAANPTRFRTHEREVQAYQRALFTPSIVEVTSWPPSRKSL